MVQEEKSMRKKNKGVLILIIVLVLLLAVYFGLRSWNVSQEEKEEAEQEAATVHVTDTAAEDIVSLKFNVGNGDLEFSKEDDKWYYTPDKDFPLQQRRRTGNLRTETRLTHTAWTTRRTQ